MLRRATVFIFMGILTLAGAGISVAGIYKWTDAEGNVHYGAERPRDTAAEEVKIKAAAPAAVSRPAAAGGPETDQPGAPVSEDPAAVKQAEIHSKNCEISKSNLKVLEGGGLRLVTSNPDGSTKHWPEIERQARIAEAKKQVDFYCADKQE